MNRSPISWKIGAEPATLKRDEFQPRSDLNRRQWASEPDPFPQLGEGQI